MCIINLINNLHNLGIWSNELLYPPSHIHTKSSSLYLPISPPPKPHFYRPTPNHPHSYIPHVHCPNHLNLPHLTTSSTLTTPRRLYKSTLRCQLLPATHHERMERISHHHPFSPLQTLQIHFLHRLGLSPICQCTLDTSPVYLSL